MCQPWSALCRVAESRRARVPSKSSCGHWSADHCPCRQRRLHSVPSTVTGQRPPCIVPAQRVTRFPTTSGAKAQPSSPGAAGFGLVGDNVEHGDVLQANTLISMGQTRPPPEAGRSTSRRSTRKPPPHGKLQFPTSHGPTTQSRTAVLASTSAVNGGGVHVGESDGSRSCSCTGRIGMMRYNTSKALQLFDRQLMNLDTGSLADRIGSPWLSRCSL